MRVEQVSETVRLDEIKEGFPFIYDDELHIKTDSKNPDTDDAFGWMVVSLEYGNLYSMSVNAQVTIANVKTLEYS
jgi:hypothetical protein